MKNITTFIILVLLAFCGCEQKGCIDGDCKNGYGTFKYSNGGTDIGYWKYGKMNGLGKQIQGEGEFKKDRYEGNFKNGLYNGKGKYYFSKFDSYLEGKWINGKPEGLCVVTFGAKSLWDGSFSGVWENGENPTFKKFLRITKNGQYFSYTPIAFLDSINFYYNSCKIQGVINQIINIHKKDLSKEKVTFEEVSCLIDSINKIQKDIDFALFNISLFKEYDDQIKYKQETINYLNSFKKGVKNDLSNYILTIQHNPNEHKTQMIYDIIHPFVEKI